jgi:uncharacterized protein (TIGR02246 family)
MNKDVGIDFHRAARAHGNADRGLARTRGSRRRGDSRDRRGSGRGVECRRRQAVCQSPGGFTNLFGMVMYGAPAFERRHTEILSTFYKGTSKKHVIRRIRFVTPDVAIVDIDNEVHGVKSMPAGITVPKDGVVKTQLMEVFVRRGGQWWVEAYHNVDVKPSAQPSEPSLGCAVQTHSRFIFRNRPA